ncbi:uncharacterized protein BDV17DRAFT_162502 [Aspergillus undulatus]|uniref:uncharacterized protein n=1 Tax=Aspergillus undulatus TaxID=1810928 RepID=UPI003CCDE3E1
MPLSPHFSVSAPRPMAQDLVRPSTGASSSDTPDHSVHMRSRSAAHPQSPKRLSVFSGRSRSNTTTSSSASASSSRRPPSSMASNEHAPFSSAYEDRTGPAAVPRHDRHESATKSLFQRGSRILRRQGSKVNMVGTPEEEEEMERERSRFGRRKSRPSDAHEQMKRMISDPFDFHHLTHTSQAQFQSLGKTRENDLVTEFSAIRASQKPVTNLKGIRADDINMRSLSAEDLAHCVTAQDNADPTPASPPRSPGARSTSPRQLEYRPLRESRIFENFSRPVPRYPRGDAPSSPPRASSPKLASSPEIPEPSPRVIDEILDLDFRQPNPEYVYFTDEDSTHGSSASPKGTSSVNRSSLGHAITTGPGIESMDARAVTALASPTSDLEDVPEEEDATHWHDSPQSQPSEYHASLDTQVSPKTNVRPKNHMSINVAKELSRKFSEALGSPTLPQHLLERASMSTEERPSQSSLRRQSSIHQNTIHETIYESWEDDIDYCYEHAAESNSDFDWARTSLDESRKQGVAVTVTGSNGSAFSAQRPVSSTNPRYLSASDLSTPDLDPSPSRLAATPSSAGYESEMSNQKDGGFFQPVSSSVLSGALTKHISPDSLYEDYLAADGESDRHFSFCSQGGFQAIEHPVSPRSSFSPISKYNSQESLILSRAASIVRKHRSSVSTTSVPELVHSLASSRDFSTSDLMLPGDQTELARQDSSSHSSQHRQTKSLAREIENQLMSRPHSNGSIDSNKLMSATIHDRAKSTSEMETAPLVSKANRPELPAKSTQRKKSRTPSYSLFPTPPTPTTTHH